MANIGHFDADLRAAAWFDPAAIVDGWFDYGMPFQHDLMGDTPAAPIQHPSLFIIIT